MANPGKSGAKRNRVDSLSDEMQIPLPQRSLHPKIHSNSIPHPHFRNDDILHFGPSGSDAAQPVESRFGQPSRSMLGESSKLGQISDSSVASVGPMNDNLVTVSGAVIGPSGTSRTGEVQKLAEEQGRDKGSVDDMPQNLYVVLKKGTVDSQASVKILAVFREKDGGQHAADEYVAMLWEEFISNDNMIARVVKKTTRDEVWFRKPGYVNLYQTRLIGGRFAWTGPRRGVLKDEGTFEIEVELTSGIWPRDAELFVTTTTNFGFEDRHSVIDVRFLAPQDNHEALVVSCPKNNVSLWSERMTGMDASLVQTNIPKIQPDGMPTWTILNRYNIPEPPPFSTLAKIHVQVHKVNNKPKFLRDAQLGNDLSILQCLNIEPSHPVLSGEAPKRHFLERIKLDIELQRQEQQRKKRLERPFKERFAEQLQFARARGASRYASRRKDCRGIGCGECEACREYMSATEDGEEEEEEEGEGEDDAIQIPAWNGSPPRQGNCNDCGGGGCCQPGCYSCVDILEDMA